MPVPGHIIRPDSDQLVGCGLTVFWRKGHMFIDNRILKYSGPQVSPDASGRGKHLSGYLSRTSILVIVIINMDDVSTSNIVRVHSVSISM